MGWVLSTLPPRSPEAFVELVGVQSVVIHRRRRLRQLTKSTPLGRVLFVCLCYVNGMAQAILTMV